MCSEGDFKAIHRPREEVSTTTRVAAKRPGYMIRREMYVLRARRGHNELVIHFSFLARY